MTDPTMSPANPSTPPPAYSENKEGLVAGPTDTKHTQEQESNATQTFKEQAPSVVAQLEVDFTWRNLTALITRPETPSDPIYIVDYRTLRSPHLLFKEAANNATVGSGTLHPISINADYELHGEKHKLKALRRLHTEYEHLSRIYSDTSAPVPMHWSSEADFKAWDFICAGPDGVPVARFSSNAWSRKKVGSVFFYGSRGLSKEAQEEIVVTGLTLYSCMLLRTSSFLSLIGGLFSQPGPLPNPEAEKLGMGETGQ
ncbi:hypothetical protein QQS21_001275 [Conoideocrella luteorostrata]|uniref:Uncharacterized protein n=1 Tax=Conoideocrella luteorostrata TaxID=1105319 RepID=A0AAJ0FYD9_9HYPO|nr:hypothetical protein QQS21_001275 [Conoideocrella luteorostrata]